jgi:hypothetical protein
VISGFETTRREGFNKESLFSEDEPRGIYLYVQSRQNRGGLLSRRPSEKQGVGLSIVQPIGKLNQKPDRRPANNAQVFDRYLRKEPNRRKFQNLLSKIEKGHRGMQL